MASQDVRAISAGRAFPASVASASATRPTSLADRWATSASYSSAVLADAEEAALLGGRLVKATCCECFGPVEALQMLDEEGRAVYTPREPRAIFCGGCFEVVCGRCAPKHPAPLACEVELRAVRRAGAA